ncbi:MAG: 23S rRNA pseudouridine(1911/1915/1917) synthase RluD [SAR86 cluster bacterium]|uniref:Pseudouridine synthase n=1 Tax=SAR86 cluster bacterium TaxID=2030880 RepID=A0A2A4MJK3_9GAMM|nr:MAG: 23S rRNA pseudouridine(1911/1915/1917) synthase RluD [SAR86 cluster bacterium]
MTNTTKTIINLQATVPEELSGTRLDQIAAKMFPDYSRARIQGWIKQGSLLVNHGKLRPRDKVHHGDEIVVNAELTVVDSWGAEDLALDVVYEDEQLIIINKAVGIVVHPAAGHRQGTLLNGLLHHCPALEEVPRAGIVHRLDKDTSGLMVVAKTVTAHLNLVTQLQKRAVTREYEAVVNGVLTGGGTVDQPLDRHPVNRKKRAVVANGKQSITHYRVLKRFRAHSHILAKLETGRTHQIRVHMSHLRYPLVGDQVYGGRLQIPRGSSERLIEVLHGFKRQALHAKRLMLLHPKTHKEMSWEQPLPEDIVALLSALQADE